MWHHIVITLKMTLFSGQIQSRTKTKDLQRQGLLVETSREVWTSNAMLILMLLLRRMKGVSMCRSDRYFEMEFALVCLSF